MKKYQKSHNKKRQSQSHYNLSLDGHQGKGSLQFLKPQLNKKKELGVSLFIYTCTVRCFLLPLPMLANNISTSTNLPNA